MKVKIFQTSLIQTSVHKKPIHLVCSVMDAKTPNCGLLTGTVNIAYISPIQPREGVTRAEEQEAFENVVNDLMNWIRKNKFTLGIY